VRWAAACYAPQWRVTWRAGFRSSSSSSLLAALASAQQNYKLNGELVAPRPVAGDVDSAAFSPDGSRIVYLADQDTLGKVELFSVPSDGSAPAVRLNGPLEDGGEVPEFRIDSTGQRVVFRVRPTADYQFELHSAPIDGSAGAIRLSKPSTPDEYPLYFELTPDGKRVVYLTSGSTGNSRHRLYSASVDGAEPAVPLTVFPGYVFEFELSPDGERVAFSADVTGNGNLNVYSVRIGGWSAGHAQRLPRPRPVRLSPPESVVFDFLVSPDGARVVFDDSHTDVLYSVPIGGGSPVPLHGPMVTNGRPIDFQVAPGRVVYVADAEEDETFELFSVPIDGSSFPVELHSHPEEDRDVFNDFRITPDGARVVFRADLRANDVRELFVAPVDGSAAAVPVLATPRSIGTWELAGNGTHVAFTSGSTVRRRSSERASTGTRSPCA
jgi:Tol biopolymer transport system component